MHIGVRHDPAAERIIFQIIKDPVHLIKHAFFVLALYADLIAISFSDGTGLICPLVPYMAVQVMNIG